METSRAQLLYSPAAPPFFLDHSSSHRKVLAIPLPYLLPRALVVVPLPGLRLLVLTTLQQQRRRRRLAPAFTAAHYTSAVA